MSWSLRCRLSDFQELVEQLLPLKRLPYLLKCLCTIFVLHDSRVICSIIAERKGNQSFPSICSGLGITPDVSMLFITSCDPSINFSGAGGNMRALSRERNLFLLKNWWGHNGDKGSKIWVHTALIMVCHFFYTSNWFSLDTQIFYNLV